MSIQVNIFNSGSVPTATELANFINELSTDLDSIVTLNTEQIIEGAKTFWGSKMLKFKQKTTADKLGFTFYDNQGKEVGNFEYDNKNNFRLLALGNYYSSANQEIEGHVGFKVYNKLALAAYRLLCPLAGNVKNSIPSLTDTYTNFYMPLVFTNGAVSVTTDNNGKVDLSTLISSGGGGGDISGLATVATTGNYNDLLNKPSLFSGNYNDLTHKPTLFSGSYGDLTDKPTLFSGDYNDLTNKPTIPVVDITKAQADGWYQPIGDYALASELFSGSYDDLTDKPALFSGSYDDLSDKPTIPTVPAISTNITSDAASDTKTASPKAVKDFVEGKGYITQSAIDNVLLSTSEHAVQNRILYNELRITESDTSSAVTIDSVTNDDGEEVIFTTLDANDFATATVGGRQVSIFPSSQYSPGNSLFVRNCLGKVFVFEGSNRLSNMDFFIAFDRRADTEFLDGSSNVFSYPSIEWFTWFRSDEVQQITGTQYYYFRDIVVMDWDVDATVPSSIVKSLKQKIEELESNISVDSELSSVSEKALQNKVLYDELRVTESSSNLVLTVNGTNYPIVELNANQFNSISWNEYGTDYSAVVIPTLDENKAYYITNVSDDDSYVFENSGEFILNFDNNPSIFGNRTEFGTHTWANSWISIPINIEIQDDYYTYYYGDSVYYDNATRLTSATVTQVSGTPIVKSLKQKIAELEARIEQISARLQS